MLLITPVLVLAVLTVLLPFLDRWLGREAGWLVAAVFAVLAGVLITHAPAVLAGRTPEVDLPWIPAFDVGLRLRLDGLGLSFALMVLLIGALVKAYSTRYFPRGNQHGLYPVLTLFGLAMLGVVLADDIVLLYVSWELTTICSFLLIGRKGAEASNPAVRTVVTTAAGGMALLAAVVVLWLNTGTTQLSEILADPSWQQDEGVSATVMVLLLFAACAKSAQFPLHFWLPDAMAASTPVSAYLHAATMVKAGVYLVLRFSPAYADDARWQLTLLAVGLVTAVYGAVLALGRHDLKELLAYSTISQLGLMMATAGLGTPEALVAVTVHVIAHALFKSTLFMTAGMVEHETHTRDLRELSGLRRTMPLTALISVLGAASLAGLPPFLGFISKEKLFKGFAHAELPLTAWLGGGLAVAASVLTVAYAFRFLTPFLGVLSPTAHEGERVPTAFTLGPAVAGVAGLWVGLAPGRLGELFSRVGVDVAGTDTHTSLGLWHGLTPELGMSALALAGGGLLVVARRPVGRMLDRVRAPVTGTAVFDGAVGSVDTAGRGLRAVTEVFSPTRHVMAALLVLATIGLWAVPIAFSVRPEPVTRATDWVILAPLVAAVVGAALSRSRIATMVLVSVAGFMVALWYLALGGADLAMTQLLVEVLLVVVAVLVLRRLPRRYPQARGARRAWAVVVAVSGGLLAGAATFALTGRRERSPAAQWYIDHAAEETKGTNIVNTILTEFRAMDTFGEMTVLGTAGLSVVALCVTLGLPLVHAQEGPRRQSSRAGRLLGDPADNTVMARVVESVLGPALAIFAGYLLLRGHYQPGGGFIAGLVAGGGMAVSYLSAPAAERAKVPRRFAAYTAAGLLTAIVAGALGFFKGGFLTTLSYTIEPLGYTISTALLFDLGVFGVVFGTVTGFLRVLGAEHPIEPRRADPHGLDEDDPDYSGMDGARGSKAAAVPGQRGGR